MQQIKIRKSILSDLTRLTEIYNQAIAAGNCTCDLNTFSEEQRKPWLTEHINNSRFPLFTCLYDGIPVGYAYFTPYRNGRGAVIDVAEISYYIDFAYHRQGIGSMFMQFMLNEAKKLRYTNLVAILIASNDGSVALLEKYGFSEWGRLPGIVQIAETNMDHLYYGRQI